MSYICTINKDMEMIIISWGASGKYFSANQLRTNLYSFNKYITGFLLFL